MYLFVPFIITTLPYSSYFIKILLFKNYQYIIKMVLY